MRPHISSGGFFVSANRHHDTSDLEHRLKKSGARAINLTHKGIVLAVWVEFQGQGLWTDNKDVIVYDLDLTNKTELRQLANFTEGDADLGNLLWTLYKKFGLGFLDRLRGAFAFALWDHKDEKLLVATDPFGIRPIVFSQKPENFIAASRIRHILNYHNVSEEIDPGGIYHYLFFQAICSPLTIYKEIRKLEPGKGMIFSEDVLTFFTHFDLKYQPDFDKNENYWIGAIPREIEKAVKRFIPLSPYERTGCFLSGGTDSSTIAGYYTNLTGRPAKTFSIGFDHPQYNEIDYARTAANYFGTDQKEYFVTPNDVLDLIGSLVEIYEEPFGNASVVPAYYCALLARENGIEVLLGGDGGDEIFGGNERYVSNLLFDTYFLLPRYFRHNLIEALLAKLPSIGLFYKAKRYIRRANIPNPERFFSYNLLAETDLKEVFNADFLSQVDPDCFINLAKKNYNKVASAHITDRLLYIDMKFTITDNDLRKVTQMAETTGLRVRYPLLDRDLVEFTTKIPPTLKVKFKKNRYLFKRAMENFLPDEIIKKKKHGMGLPIAHWLRTDKGLSIFLNDMLLTGEPRILEYVRSEFINTLNMKFIEDESTPYWGNNLWVFLMLELWLRNADA